jgi:hypothetical protein
MVAVEDVVKDVVLTMRPRLRQDYYSWNVLFAKISHAVTVTVLEVLLTANVTDVLCAALSVDRKVHAMFVMKRNAWWNVRR